MTVTLSNPMIGSVMSRDGLNPNAVQYDPSIPDGLNATLDSPISIDGRPRPDTIYEVPTRCGRAVRLDTGQVLKLINPSGHQVCDLWAFCADDMRELLSMEHVRTALGRTMPRPRDVLVSNRRRPMLELVEDSSPGVHDTTIAACDAARYRQLGVDGYHDNCVDNLRMALMAIGEKAPEVPSPLNVWMNIPVSPDGSFEWLPPVARPGDWVSIRALQDCIVVMSACPQDITPVNGANGVPEPLEFTVCAGPAR
ncbi:MAG: urea carboxylase-associated family protein [Phyllobacteriaceae bacterium]|jgi:uncharacterized protein YcgI (DUF1989 family)|nr:urea carboxylase-associated family protein [Phyllobacteriaceae bacterium]